MFVDHRAGQVRERWSVFFSSTSVASSSLMASCHLRQRLEGFVFGVGGSANVKTMDKS